MFEEPPEVEQENTDPLSCYRTAEDDFALMGHDVIAATQGKHSGHYCPRCKTINAVHKFNNWRVKPCRPDATGKQRKAAFENDYGAKAKAARLAREQFMIYDSESEHEKVEDPGTPINKKQPHQTDTAEDDREAAEINE